MDIKHMTPVIGALILSLGLVGAGMTIGKGLYRARKAERIVTVKGLAEQDVTSNLGLWDVNYREIGNDLSTLYAKIQHDHQILAAFLKERGFNDTEIDRLQMRIEDRFANAYNQNLNSQLANEFRYVVTSGTRIRTTNVKLIEKSLRELDVLLQQGVMLTFDASTLNPNPGYYYTNLDTIRPAMMSAATKSAYTIASQFARDSGSELAGIQRANQGVFQVMSRDTSTMSSDWESNQSALGSINKKVRLVTTIVYGLK